MLKSVLLIFKWFLMQLCLKKCDFWSLPPWAIIISEKGCALSSTKLYLNNCSLDMFIKKTTSWLCSNLVFSLIWMFVLSLLPVNSDSKCVVLGSSFAILRFKINVRLVYLDKVTLTSDVYFHFLYLWHYCHCLRCFGVYFFAPLLQIFVL